MWQGNEAGSSYDQDTLHKCTKRSRSKLKNAKEEKQKFK